MATTTECTRDDTDHVLNIMFGASCCGDDDDPSGCWAVFDCNGRLISILIGHKSEVVGAVRLLDGYFQNGRYGSTILVPHSIATHLNRTYPR